MATREITAERARIAVKKYAEFKTRVEAVKTATIFDKAEKAEAALDAAGEVMGDLCFLINDLVELINEGAEHGQ